MLSKHKRELIAKGQSGKGYGLDLREVIEWRLRRDVVKRRKLEEAGVDYDTEITFGFDLTPVEVETVITWASKTLATEAPWHELAIALLIVCGRRSADIFQAVFEPTETSPAHCKITGYVKNRGGPESYEFLLLCDYETLETCGAPKVSTTVPTRLECLLYVQGITRRPSKGPL